MEVAIGALVGSKKRINALEVSERKKTRYRGRSLLLPKKK